jgi:hypothetical protein
MAMAAMMPMITTTITSSIRLKPRRAAGRDFSFDVCAFDRPTMGRAPSEPVFMG